MEARFPIQTPSPATAPVDGLAAEIRKTSPFRVPEEEVYLNTLKTLAHLSERVHALFRENGVSEPLYNILRILAGNAAEREAAGRPDEGLAVTEIADRMLTREPDMTRLVDRLEHLGHVRRERSHADRRRVQVVATFTGRALANGLRPRLEALHAEQLGHMSREELTQLNTLLRKARSRPSDSSHG